MFMALDKFRAAVLIVAAGFHNDFAAIVQAANKAKTRVVVLADTGESAQRHMSNGAHGVVYRNVTSAAWSIASAKSRATKHGCRTWPCPANLPKTIWSGCACATG